MNLIIGQALRFQYEGNWHCGFDLIVYDEATDLELCRVDALAIYREDWTLRDDKAWPAISAVLATNAGVSQKDYEASFDLCMELRLLAFGFDQDRFGSGERSVAIETFQKIVEVEDLTIDQFVSIWQEARISFELKGATASAKRHALKQRRKEFANNRAELVLALINSGKEYICAVNGCFEHKDLTVDHIFPVCRGGTDAAENLQFMCRKHNSQKGSKVYFDGIALETA